MRNVLPLGCILLLVVSCKDTGTDIPELVPVPFNDVENFGCFWSIPDAGTAVIKEDSTWLRYWENYWGCSDGTGKTPPPAVDFSRQMVLGVFYGKGYSGNDNKVSVIREIWKSRTSLIVEVGPLPDLGFGDQTVMPLQMVTVPKSDLEVVFVGNVPGNPERKESSRMDQRIHP